MDPIEKLLSELAPTNAPDGLDYAMKRLFDGADARARRWRFARGSLAIGATLALGLGLGYRLGGARETQPAIPPIQSSVTYIYPIQTGNHAPALDVSVQKEEWLRAPVQIFVESQPALAVFSPAAEGSR